MGRPFKPTPTDINARQKNQLTRNIVNLYKEAKPETIQKGLSWYPQAHDFANRLGQGDVAKGAGVIAALSPSTAWDVNIAQAKELVNLGQQQIDALYDRDRSVLAGMYLNRQSTDNIIKAHRIWEGEHPRDLLAMRVKTGHFFENIHDPTNEKFVTIDTHAHDIARNRPDLPYKTERGLSAYTRYDNFADAYFRAADHLDLDVANQVQAVTWTHWRMTRKGKQGGGDPEW